MSTRDTEFAAAVRMGFVVDVAGYGRRSAPQKVDIQHRLSLLIDEVLRDLGLQLTDTYHHGTGDGMVVFLPAEVEVHRALGRLLRSASEVLAADNERFRDRMRLRMAVVIGPLGPAAIGFSGNTIVEAGRMVDSDPLRQALAEYPRADLVALISDQLHAYVVRERHTGVDPADFRPVSIDAKELQTQAWLWSGTDAGLARHDQTAPERFQLGANSDCLLGLLAGPILRVHRVDVWVNSENTDMEMPRHNDFSISSIIRYHGSRRDDRGWVVEDTIADELASVVAGRTPVAPGSAFVTGAGSLTRTHGVRWIIHVAAVQGEPGAGFRQVRRVGACVSSALAEAERLARHDGSRLSILFPLLGAGVAGGAVGPTSADMVESAVDHLTSTPDTYLRGIYFLGYTDAEQAALTGVLQRHPALRPATGEA